MKTTTNFSELTTEQIKTGLIKYVNNKKKCDKLSLWFLLGMVQPVYVYGYVQSYSRGEILNKLIEYINNEPKNIYKLTSSNYMKNKILINL